MRTEFLEYALLSDEERETVSLLVLDASVEEYELFWSSINAIKAARSEA